MVQTLYRARVAPNFRKFPLTALCIIDAERVVSRLVLDGTLFALAQIFHFQALFSISFLLICILEWCKHSTGLEVAPNFHKFPLTALRGIDAERVVSRPVLDGTLFAPTQILNFQTLLPLVSFSYAPSIGANYRARVCPEFPQISIDGGMTSSCRSILQARSRRYTFCTDPGFIFSGSPSP